MHSVSLKYNGLVFFSSCHRARHQQASRKACLVSSACFPHQFGSSLELNFLKDRFSLDTEMMVGLVFLDLCRAILNKGGRVGTRNAYLLIDMHLDSHFWVQIQASCCWIPQTQWNAWTFLQRALDAYIPGVCATPLTPVILYEITSELVTVHYCTLNVLIYHFGASSASFNSGFLLQNRMLQ